MKQSPAEKTRNQKLSTQKARHTEPTPEPTPSPPQPAQMLREPTAEQNHLTRSTSQDRVLNSSCDLLSTVLQVTHRWPCGGRVIRCGPLSRIRGDPAQYRQPGERPKSKSQVRFLPSAYSFGTIMSRKAVSSHRGSSCTPNATQNSKGWTLSLRWAVCPRETGPRLQRAVGPAHCCLLRPQGGEGPASGLSGQ